MKTARIMQDKTGYWVIYCGDTGRAILRICETELEAYQTANANGYLIN